MNKLKKPLLFALCLLPVAIVAGIFVGFYQLEIYSDEVIAQITETYGNKYIVIVSTTVTAVIYTLFCGFFGYILADKTGLWKPVKLQKKALLVTVIISVIGGGLLSLDYWVFGNFIEGVKEADASGLTVIGLFASILYGGIIEELMLRLFFMSLIAFIVWKLFFRKADREHIPASVFIAAIIAALLFAAGHLPATISIFGTLTPLLIIRCFILNGLGAIIFGWLYRKYGIVYAMMSHAIFHIVMKLIWLIFI